MQSDPDRRTGGDQNINEILGQTAEQVERTLGDIAPDLATYVVETINGEIYQSPVPSASAAANTELPVEHLVQSLLLRVEGRKPVLLLLVRLRAGREILRARLGVSDRRRRRAWHFRELIGAGDDGAGDDGAGYDQHGWN